jgi:hypothetical protein
MTCATDITVRILSNAFGARFCAYAYIEVVRLYEAPEPVTTYNRSQFASDAFVSAAADGARSSVVASGGCKENIFIHRLCRSLEYEKNYLRAYDKGATVKQFTSRFINIDNTMRPDSSKKPEMIKIILKDRELFQAS